MSKGQFGARDLAQAFVEVADPGIRRRQTDCMLRSPRLAKTAAAGASKQLERLRQERDRVTVTIARRELRKWLRASDEGKAVEDVVGRLLGHPAS